jgi:hypothetical protein
VCAQPATFTVVRLHSTICADKWIAKSYGDIILSDQYDIPHPFWSLTAQTVETQWPAHTHVEIPEEVTNNTSSSSSFTGFYNPLAGFSLLVLEVSRSHTMTQHSR